MPSVQPARPAEVEHVRLDRLARRGEYSQRSSGGTNAASSASARASAPGSTTRSTWISKSRAQIVTSTPSPSPPASASARATADSLTAEEAEDAPARAAGRGRAAARTRPSRARAATAASAPRRPGQDDRDPSSPRPITRPGAVPASPSEIAPSGIVACFVTPGGEVGVVALQPHGGRARDLLDLRLELRVDVQADAERLRHHLDRAVVVRRAEPAGDEARVGGEPSRSAASSSSGESPTIAIRAGSRPRRSASRARNGPFRSVRSPRTSSLPVTTMSGAGPAQAAARAVRVGVTSTFRLRPRGQRDGLAAERDADAAGAAHVEPEAAAVDPLDLPGRASPGAARADRRARRTSTYVPRFTPVSWRPRRRAASPLGGCGATAERRAPSRSPPNFQATITSAVSTAMPASATARAPCARCRGSGGPRRDAPRRVLEARRRRSGS